MTSLLLNLALQIKYLLTVYFPPNILPIAPASVCCISLTKEVATYQLITTSIYFKIIYDPQCSEGKDLGEFD